MAEHVAQKVGFNCTINHSPPCILCQVIFLSSSPTSSSDLRLRLALSISVMNEVCVVSRSAAWPLKLALFPVPWSVSIGQPHRLCFFFSTKAKWLFTNRKHSEFVFYVSGKTTNSTWYIQLVKIEYVMHWDFHSRLKTWTEVVKQIIRTNLSSANVH